MRASGQQPDPRLAQLERLKDEVGRLKDRVTARDATIAELTGFKTLAVSRLAAQHEEIERLRKLVGSAVVVRAVTDNPSRTT
ncbi:hypothetical protein [Nonomuraea sp. NPDC050540]|uniref:hypothetical protein n=1 Tax=Nonomuraea sp. NPDC050540 TaxID=3364367 RepID=UPI00379D07C4